MKRILNSLLKNGNDAVQPIVDVGEVLPRSADLLFPRTLLIRHCT